MEKHGFRPCEHHELRQHVGSIVHFMWPGSVDPEAASERVFSAWTEEVMGDGAVLKAGTVQKRAITVIVRREVIPVDTPSADVSSRAYPDGRPFATLYNQAITAR